MLSIVNSVSNFIFRQKQKLIYNDYYMKSVMQ